MNEIYIYTVTVTAIADPLLKEITCDVCCHILYDNRAGYFFNVWTTELAILYYMTTDIFRCLENRFLVVPVICIFVNV